MQPNYNNAPNYNNNPYNNPGYNQGYNQGYAPSYSGNNYGGPGIPNAIVISPDQEKAILPRDASHA